MFVSRQEYRKREDLNYLDALKKKFGDFFLLPEGGSNQLAIRGVAELVDEINIDFDYIFVASGTGATLAGIITKLKKHQRAIGVAVLKNSSFINDNVNDFIKSKYDNWQVFTQYHFGGYAKVNGELINFILDFQQKYNIKLDQVYMGKTLFAVFDSIKNGFIKPNSNIIVVHSGGIQGSLEELR